MWRGLLVSMWWRRRASGAMSRGHSGNAPLVRIADILVREIQVGTGDTGIRAGVVKVANDAEGVTPEAERVLRGAVRAVKRTGCPVRISGRRRRLDGDR